MIGTTYFRPRRRVDSHGDNRIMIASRKGDLAKMELLLENKKLINEQDSHGYTPLFYAVSGRHVGACFFPFSLLEAVRYLLDNGASIGHQASQGTTVLMYAVMNSNESCVECLCEFLDQHPFTASSPLRPIIDLQNTDGFTALMLACKAGSSSFCDIFLRHGANASLRDFSGQTAFNYALSHNATSCVQTLIDHCGFVDTRSRANPHGALFTAAQLQEPSILHFLVVNPPYLRQFLTEIVLSPSRAEEVAVEVALRDEIPRLSDDSRETLYKLCIGSATACLRQLLDVAENAEVRRRASLAGLAECAKWCIKMGKVMNEVPTLPSLDPCWDQIEKLVRTESSKFRGKCELVESSSGSSEEGSGLNSAEGETRNEQKVRVKPTSSSRLLLSFLEIYALAHYNLRTKRSSEEKEEAWTRLQSVDALHPRLIMCFSENREYLK